MLKQISLSKYHILQKNKYNIRINNKYKNISYNIYNQILEYKIHKQTLHKKKCFLQIFILNYIIIPSLYFNILSFIFFTMDLK